MTQNNNESNVHSQHLLRTYYVPGTVLGTFSCTRAHSHWWVHRLIGHRWHTWGTGCNVSVPKVHGWAMGEGIVEDTGLELKEFGVPNICCSLLFPNFYVRIKIRRLQGVHHWICWQPYSHKGYKLNQIGFGELSQVGNWASASFCSPGLLVPGVFFFLSFLF